MILVQTFRAKQPKTILDKLNKESGRIYTLTMVSHWRAKRKKEIWLSQYDAMRLNDALSGSTILHAHSRDAAQEGFYKACKTAKALKQAGFIDARYPYHPKTFRSTTWKKQGIRVKEDKLILARARGLDPIVISLPEYLQGYDILEVRLVFDQKSCKYNWHITYDDKLEMLNTKGQTVVAVDLGEIHPAAVCTEKEAVVISARELRATIQGQNKAKAELSEKQDKLTKYSRYWKKLQRTKNKRAGRFKLKQRDICHKVSRAIIDFAEAHDAGKIVIGDIRDVGDEVNKGKLCNQKIAQFPHGIIQHYTEYKAKRKGIKTKLKNEAYSSQTCPNCGQRNKARGRVYKCKKCRWTGHRDGQVGVANILSLEVHGELGRVLIPEVKYRHPYLVGAMGKRSHADTMQVACSSELQEAVGL